MAHAEMLAALDQYKASGRLRPYTPLAVTLDKTRDHLAMTPAERRVSSVVSASELGEAHTAAVETRVQRIMEEMQATGSRMRSAGLPPHLLNFRAPTTAPSGWSGFFDDSGAAPLSEPRASPAAAGRRTATPELFNRLSLESEGGWANATTGSADQWAALGLGDGPADGAVLQTGCERILQSLAPGEAPPPVQALRPAPDAIVAPLTAEVERLLKAGDTIGVIAAQQRLVLRLAQRHLCARREGWDDGGPEAALLLRQAVSQVVRFQLSAATSTAAFLAGVATHAPQWLQICADLTAERGLWDQEQDDTRRELRAGVFEAFSHTAAVKGRPSAAQKWLRKAASLIEGMSADAGGRKLELAASAHLNLCHALSVGGKHAEALPHALRARQQVLLRLSIDPSADDIAPTTGETAQADLPPSTMENIVAALQREGGEAGGAALGELLAAAYHNCAVQQEVLGAVGAAIASIEMALSLAQHVFGGQEKGGQLQQYRQTHRAMVKAAEAAGKRAPPAKPPPSDERRRGKPGARRREAPARRNGGQQRVLPRLSGARSASPDAAAIAHRRQAEKLYRNEGRLRPLTPLVVTLNKPLSVRRTHSLEAFLFSVLISTALCADGAAGRARALWHGASLRRDQLHEQGARHGDGPRSVDGDCAGGGQDERAAGGGRARDAGGAGSRRGLPPPAGLADVEASARAQQSCGAERRAGLAHGGACTHASARE